MVAGLIVCGLGGHDVGHEGLRVAVVEREPGALDLDHHGVAGLEDVVHVVQRELVLVNGAGAQRRGLVEARQIAAAEDFSVGHQLVAAHRGVGIVVGVLVDELDDQVVVRCRWWTAKMSATTSPVSDRSFVSTGSFHTATSLRSVTKR